MEERLVRLDPGVHTPAISTVHAVLDRHGLVKRGGRAGATGRRGRRSPFPASPTTCGARFRQPIPLRMRGALHHRGSLCLPVFEAGFREFCLPEAVCIDNGVRFASPDALFGLSKLSVWWLRLGSEIERIKPPAQNGRAMNACI